jgi:hypothetical protein
MDADPKGIDRIHATVCAVIFGANETLLKIKLNNGYQFQKMSLIPSVDNLDKIFDTSAMGLRREYETARIDDSLNVVCAFKEMSFYNDSQQLDEIFSKICDEALSNLDNDIRCIRFVKESPLRFKTLSINIKVGSDNSYLSLIPIGEATATEEISRFNCTDAEVDEINKFVSECKLPLINSLLNHCFVFYDLSYHQPNSLSIVLLFTCLEMLFLENEQAKKERLSKRCALFLHIGQKSRQECYRILSDLYKKRSNFVHDGNNATIDNGDILYLRECVRKSIIKYRNSDLDKKQTIKDLRLEIDQLDYFTKA